MHPLTYLKREKNDRQVIARFDSQLQVVESAQRAIVKVVAAVQGARSSRPAVDGVPQFAYARHDSGALHPYR